MRYRRSGSNSSPCPPPSWPGWICRRPCTRPWWRRSDPTRPAGPHGRTVGRQPVRVADRMPEGLLARRGGEHRQRRHRRGLLTGGADPHVSTLGGQDHQDRGGIKALLAEMPRERRRRRRGLHLPDLRDAEGETAVRSGRLGPELLTHAASHMPMDHPSSSSGAVAPGSVVRSSRDRPHARPGAAATRRYRLVHLGRPSPAGIHGQQHGCWQEAPSQPRWVHLRTRIRDAVPDP